MTPSDPEEVIGSKCKGLGAKTISKEVMAETRTQLEKIEKICKDGLNRCVGAERERRSLLAKGGLLTVNRMEDGAWKWPCVSQRIMDER